MNQQDLEHQEEYETRVLYFKTDFKGRYISGFTNGFNPRKFVGTRKEYDKATEMYKNHSNGKIIGTHTYDSLKEFNEANEINPVEPIDFSDAFKVGDGNSPYHWRFKRRKRY